MMLRVYRKTGSRTLFNIDFMNSLGIRQSHLFSNTSLYTTIMSQSYCDGCGEVVHPQQLDPSGYLVCTDFEGNFRLSCQYLARGLDLNYGS